MSEEHPLQETAAVCGTVLKTVSGMLFHRQKDTGVEIVFTAAPISPTQHSTNFFPVFCHWARFSPHQRFFFLIILTGFSSILCQANSVLSDIRHCEIEYSYIMFVAYYLMFLLLSERNMGVVFLYRQHFQFLNVSETKETFKNIKHKWSSYTK